MNDPFSASGITLYLKEGESQSRLLTDIHLSIREGEAAGLIGESGSGKSIFWKSMLGMLDPAVFRMEGKGWIDGKEIDRKDQKQLSGMRGKAASVILQDPMSSFDAVFKIERHFWETARAHTDWSRAETRERAADLLRRLFLPDPEQVLNMYPFQCSGGMLQRVMIAIALMTDPKILIADEPTTSVDVTVQREILTMLRKLKEDRKSALLYISHDLATIENLADQIYVMYAGHIVESFPAAALREKRIYHPYTQKLLAARPAFRKTRLAEIPGSPPKLSERQSGCPFRDRCGCREAACSDYQMEQTKAAEDHFVRCLKAGDHNVLS